MSSIENLVLEKQDSLSDVRKERNLGPTFVEETQSTGSDLSIESWSECSEVESASDSGQPKEKKKKKNKTANFAKVGGKRKMLAGTMERIVQWIIEKEIKHIHRNDPLPSSDPPPLGITHLGKAFLASFRQYTTIDHLFELAEEYYKNPPKRGKMDIQEKRRHCVQFVSCWVDNGFARDFMATKKKKKPKGDVHQLNGPNANSVMKILLNLLNLMSKDFEVDVNKIKLLLLRKSAEVPSYTLKWRRKDITKLSNGRVDFLNLDTQEVAEQMTLIESNMFLCIKATEFFNQCWKKQEGKKQTSPHIVAMVDRFNTVSYWVSSTIIMCKDLKKRITMVKKYINLGEICNQLRNFNTLMAILAGLNNSSVQRLKQTWAGVKGSPTQSLELLNALMENKQNYKNYREALAREEFQSAPVVPYLGIYLRDLTFIDDGNADYLEDLINFEKLTMLGEVILQVEKWQRNGPYNFISNLERQRYLMKLLVLPEDVLYRKSELLEPSSVSQLAMT